MGLFSDIFSPNTTAATDRATAAANGLVNSTLAGTNADLNNSAGNAATALQQGAAGATNAINAGYGGAMGALTGYGQQAQGALQGGVNSAVNTAQSANGMFQPYVAGGGAASGMLANALGLNGAAGNAAATSAFQSDPGYQFALNQAIGRTQAAAAAAGMTASGNTLDAITKLASNYGNQNYQTWLSNLQNAGSQGLTAAGQVSDNDRAAAGYQYGGGTTGANLFQQTGANLGNEYAAQGTALGNLQGSLGSGIANLNTNLGTALTNNAWTGSNTVNKQSIEDANNQDAATSRNNGILSGYLGQIGGALLSGGTGGLSGLFSGGGGGIYNALSGNALNGGF